MSRAPGPVVTSDGVTLRFRAPAPVLAPLLIDYGFYDSGPAGSRVRRNEYMPGFANITMTFDAGPVRVAMRARCATWTNDAVVFGPTSHAFVAQSEGGRLIAIGVTPLGWSRLFGKHADAAADRVIPLARWWGETRARTLYDALARAGRDEDAAVAILDRHLSAALLPASRDAPAIEALTRIVQDPQVEECTDAAAALGMPETQLRRIAKHYFGFGPKLLLRRRRFMRTVSALAPADDLAIDPPSLLAPYYDQSHFIRDAHLFLGATARQFRRGLTPMMAAMMIGRSAAFGVPLQSLIAAGRDNVVDAGRAGEKATVEPAAGADAADQQARVDDSLPAP